MQVEQQVTEELEGLPEEAEAEEQEAPDDLEEDDGVEGQEDPDNDGDEELEVADEPEGEGDEVLEIGFEGEEPGPDDEARPWVKNLRKRYDEQSKRLRELEAQVAETGQPELGPEPKLVDFDYDDDAYQRAYAKWFEEKRVRDAAEAEEQAATEERNKQWQGRLQGYAEARHTLKVSNFEEAEAVVDDALSEQQKAMIIEGIDDPSDQATLVYALGRSPERLEQLASITSLARFGVALGQLQKDMKVTKRRPNTKPEQKRKSGSGAGRSYENKLDRLRAEAEKSGDYSKVIAFKRGRKE